MLYGGGTYLSYKFACLGKVSKQKLVEFSTGGQRLVDFPLRKEEENSKGLKHLELDKKHFETNSFFHPTPHI